MTRNELKKLWFSMPHDKNKKQENVSYNHDEVYNSHKERFESMNCFQKYKSYTNSNAIPAFCRDLTIS